MTDGHRELLRAGAAIYQLAARTFAAEVDPPFYRSLRDMGQGSGLTQEPGWELAPIDAHLRALPEADALDILAVEYCRLFIGPRPSCPPYAAAHTNGAALGLPARQAIHRFLDDHQIEARVPPGAPIADDDHAAIGLAALAALCTRAAEDADPPPGPAAQAACAALQDPHLLGWLPRFLGEVERHSRCGPYGPVARVTAALLREQPRWADSVRR